MVGEQHGCLAGALRRSLVVLSVILRDVQFSIGLDPDKAKKSAKQDINEQPLRRAWKRRRWGS